LEKHILQTLCRMEEEENIRILYAAESGSRAWGFASADSDYDVRFIYLRQETDYLKITRPRDVIEVQDGLLDICGWDLTKTLHLLKKSNPSLFEWAMSPVVYMAHPLWESFRPFLMEQFLSSCAMRHYLSMADGNYREWLRGDTVLLKKYLYVLRPILACKWVQTYRTAPPMLFETLAQAMLESELQEDVRILLEKKRNCCEAGYVPKNEKLNAYIEKNLLSLQAFLRQEGDTITSDFDADAVFLSLLRQAWAA